MVQQVNPFIDFLESSDFGPRINFESRLPFGFGTSQRQQASNTFPSFFNQFQGRLGQQIRANQPPTLSFENFLNEFNFPRFFKRNTQGVSPGLTSPTRFLF